MLPAKVALYDIDDVESFVCATIEKSGLRAHLSESEREDLIAEGLRILYDLAARFEPHRPGYDQAGRFSGFAAQFLPRRLGDAWHSWHPEHRRITDEDGKRRWHYSSSPLSLDQLLAPAGDSTNCESRPSKAPETTIRPREHWAPVPVSA